MALEPRRAAIRQGVVVMTLPIIPPLFTRRPWVQIVSPLLLIAALMYFTVHYYPVLN